MPQETPEQDVPIPTPLPKKHRLVTAEDAGIVDPTPKPSPEQGKTVAPWRTNVGEALPSVLGAVGGFGGGALGSSVPVVGTFGGGVAGASLGGATGRVLGNVLEDKKWNEGMGPATLEQGVMEAGGRLVAPALALARGIPWLRAGLEYRAPKTIPGIPSTRTVMDKSGLANYYRQIVNKPWLAPDAARSVWEGIKYSMRPDPGPPPPPAPKAPDVDPKTKSRGSQISPNSYWKDVEKRADKLGRKTVFQQAIKESQESAMPAFPH